MTGLTLVNAKRRSKKSICDGYKLLGKVEKKRWLCGHTSLIIQANPDLVLVPTTTRFSELYQDQIKKII
jgi:hypothetical protein